MRRVCVLRGCVSATALMVSRDEQDELLITGQSVNGLDIGWVTGPWWGPQPPISPQQSLTHIPLSLSDFPSHPGGTIIARAPPSRGASHPPQRRSRMHPRHCRPPPSTRPRRRALPTPRPLRHLAQPPLERASPRVPCRPRARPRSSRGPRPRTCSRTRARARRPATRKAERRSIGSGSRNEA